jgi:hypothetical protein
MKGDKARYHCKKKNVLDHRLICHGWPVKLLYNLTFGLLSEHQSFTYLMQLQNMAKHFKM